MTIRWQHGHSTVDWEQLSDLYRIAPLGEKSPEDLFLVFRNSRYSCFAYDGSILVAVGRALSDGLDCSYICDIAVHPEYQGQGLGQQVVQQLVQLSSGHRKIILYANPGKEAFYQKLGFHRMNTAMAIFADQAAAIRSGLVAPTETAF